MSDYSDFPWRPGMVDTYGWRVRTVRADGAAFGVDQFPTPSVRRFTGIEVPDLTDPATVGALAGAVREAYGRPDLYARPLLPGGWSVGCSRLLPTQPEVSIIADTEADAWLAAWQARPKGGA